MLLEVILAAVACDRYVGALAGAATRELGPATSRVFICSVACEFITVALDYTDWARLAALWPVLPTDTTSHFTETSTVKGASRIVVCSAYGSMTVLCQAAARVGALGHPLWGAELDLVYTELARQPGARQRSGWERACY